ncbi:MAG: ABC transporter permease subunit [Paeniclostridium sp.]
MENKIPRPLNGVFESGSILDTIFNTYATTYIALALIVVVWFVLYKTKFGLRVRAVGEHPGARDTLGINVSRVRYISVILSGILLRYRWSFYEFSYSFYIQPALISGQGYSFSAVIFGKWRPQWAGPLVYYLDSQQDLQFT